MKTKWIIITICVVIISIITSMLCILFWGNDSCVKTFCINDITNYLGLLVSGISIVITVFFAILAINAYGRIEKTKQDAEEIEKARDKAETHLKNIGGVTKTIYEVALGMVELSGRINKGDEKIININKKRRHELNRGLYCLGLKPFLLSNEERMSFIRNLRAFAEEEDLDELEKICKSDTESPEIKRVAKEVLDSFNSSEPTIINRGRWECIKSRLNTFFKGLCDLFRVC